MTVRKKIWILRWVLCAISIISTGHAQVAVAEQPAMGYFQELARGGKLVTPSQQQLLAQKRQVLPASLLDSLKKYDWYNLASYHYPEKKFCAYFADCPISPLQGSCQLNFIRYRESGIMGSFYVQQTTTGKQTVFTTTFDTATAPRLQGVRLRAGRAYLQLLYYDVVSYDEIISYKDRVLVVDINKQGRMNSPAVQFREYYYGVPKAFNW